MSKIKEKVEDFAKLREKILADIETRYKAEIIYLNEMYIGVRNELYNKTDSAGAVEERATFDGKFEIADGYYHVEVTYYYQGCGEEEWNIMLAIDADDQAALRVQQETDLRKSITKSIDEDTAKELRSDVFNYAQSLAGVKSREQKLRDLGLLNVDGTLNKNTDVYKTVYNSKGQYIGGRQY